MPCRAYRLAFSRPSAAGKKSTPMTFWLTNIYCRNDLYRVGTTGGRWRREVAGGPSFHIIYTISSNQWMADEQTSNRRCAWSVKTSTPALCRRAASSTSSTAFTLCFDECLTLWRHCCRMGTAIKHPVPDRVKPSFVILTSGQSAERQSARMSKQLNPVWHSCTHITTLGVKGLILVAATWSPPAYRRRATRRSALRGVRCYRCEDKHRRRVPARSVVARFSRWRWRLWWWWWRKSPAAWTSLFIVGARPLSNRPSSWS